MSPFTRVNPGDLIQAQNLNQVIGSLNGTSGQGVPIFETSVNDATNYALSVQNLEATNSRALNVLKSDGSLLIRADVNGVNLGNTTVTGPNLTLPNASIHNAALASDVARANLLTNGGFEVWQRGPGAFTTVGYTADRWLHNLAGTDAFSTSRDTTNVDGSSRACLACTFTLGTGAGGSNITQLLTLADGYQQANATFSASVRVRTSTANAVRIAVHTGSAYVYSSYHPGNGAYQTLTVTATETATPNLQLGIFFAASCTAYIDNAMLVVGSQPADYVPMHPADDLARCLRYYEAIGVQGGNDIAVRGWAGAAGQGIDATILWRAIKPVTPTVTKNYNWAVANTATTAPSVVGASVSGCRLELNATAANLDTYAVNANANNYVSVEANP